MKNIIIISIILLTFNISANAAFLSVTIDYNKSSNCKLDKQILKNEIYDYKEFSADQIKDNKDRKINIKAIKSQELKIIGLSDFFTNVPNGAIYDTQIIKDNTILLRVLLNDENTPDLFLLINPQERCFMKLQQILILQTKVKNFIFYV